MNVRHLKPGDKITVSNAYQRIEARTVAKVTSVSITDDKGWRWTLAGHKWGENSGWGRATCDTCEPWEQSHDADIERTLKERADKRRREYLHYFDWKKAPQSLIDACFMEIRKQEETKK